MTDPVFFLATAALLAGERLRLDGAEGHHAADVRRLRLGAALLLTDGEGHGAACTVVEVAKGVLVVEVVRRWHVGEAQPCLVVVQALAKGDRGETAVETLTEVGVDVIVPWSASRSVTRWSTERAPKALERWRSAARESAKQSRRTRWPEVRGPATTAEVVTLLRAAESGLVLHEEAAIALGQVTPPGSGDVVLVVGPEGGISPEELAAFADTGATAVRLGPSILRTSTAGTAAAAVLLSRTPRWS